MSRPWHVRWILPAFTLAGIVSIHVTDLPASGRTTQGKPAEKPSVSGTQVSSEKGKSAKSLKTRSEKPGISESKPHLNKETEQGMGTDRPSHKAHGRKSKKLPPKAIIEPKPNLSYMGKFQTPQRYDPIHDQRGWGRPNPGAGDVLHDHFQELDRNYDGVIDPFERASGRLDIDRDLANRQWH